MRPCPVRARAFFVGKSCEAMELSEIGDDSYFVKVLRVLKVLKVKKCTSRR